MIINWVIISFILARVGEGECNRKEVAISFVHPFFVNISPIQCHGGSGADPGSYRCKASNQTPSTQSLACSWTMRGNWNIHNDMGKAYKHRELWTSVRSVRQRRYSLCQHTSPSVLHCSLQCSTFSKIHTYTADVLSKVAGTRTCYSLWATSNFSDNLKCVCVGGGRSPFWVAISVHGV